MANAVGAFSPEDVARSLAAQNMKFAAVMSLHDLVDEFERLTKIMDAGITESKDGREYSDEYELAKRHRGIVCGAIRMRFGLSIDGYDRPSNSHDW